MFHCGLGPSPIHPKLIFAKVTSPDQYKLIGTDNDSDKNIHPPLPTRHTPKIVAGLSPKQGILIPAVRLMVPMRGQNVVPAALDRVHAVADLPIPAGHRIRPTYTIRPGGSAERPVAPCAATITFRVRRQRRPLGIPTVRDRVVQQAALLMLEPIFEACSHSFRPGRSAPLGDRPKNKKPRKIPGRERGRGRIICVCGAAGPRRPNRRAPEFRAPWWTAREPTSRTGQNQMRIAIHCRSNRCQHHSHTAPTEWKV